MTTRRFATALAALFLAGLLLPVASAQVVQKASADKQRFDAASIKACPPDEQVPGPGRGLAGGTNATISPGRLNVPCVTAEQLIYLAYATAGAREEERLTNDGGGASNDRKVRGGPAWVHSYRDKYAIEATAAGATDRTILMGSMLRTLLEDRFKLKIHRESEEVPMFALTVAKGGLKLKPMKEGDCDASESATFEMDPVKSRCGGLNTRLSGPNLLWTFADIDVGPLATRLSGTLGRRVIDKTGLTDKFLIRLEFHPDENTPGIVWSAERNADTSAPQAATIFTAVEQQLGLKIEQTVAPVGFIVIDLIERPTPDAPFTTAPHRARGAGAR